jgi:hypothetical protein
VARRTQASSLRAQALLRARLADRHFPRLKVALLATLRKQVREAAALAQRGDFTTLKSKLPEWKGAFITAQRKVLIAIAAETYRQAGAETGAAPRGKTQHSALSTQDSLRGKDVAAGDWEHFVLKNDWRNLDAWVNTTAEGAANTTAIRLTRIFQHAADYWDEDKQRGLTPVEIAAQILADGMTQCEARARMLAHTGAIWAANEGAVNRYADDGIAVVEWLTADDDLRCPFCADMNGKRVETKEAFFSLGDEVSLPGAGSLKIPGGAKGFDVRHPPLHPNCRCTLIPIVDTRQLEG